MFFVMKCLKISFNNTVVCISQRYMAYSNLTGIRLPYRSYKSESFIPKKLKNQPFPEGLKEASQLEALMSYTRQSDIHHYIYYVCYCNKTIIGGSISSVSPQNRLCSILIPIHIYSTLRSLKKNS